MSGKKKRAGSETGAAEDLALMAAAMHPGDEIFNELVYVCLGANIFFIFWGRCDGASDLLAATNFPKKKKKKMFFFSDVPLSLSPSPPPSLPQ
jgi:hypothetical protein